MTLLPASNDGSVARMHMRARALQHAQAYTHKYAHTHARTHAEDETLPWEGAIEGRRVLQFGSARCDYGLQSVVFSTVPLQPHSQYLPPYICIDAPLHR